MAIGKIGIYKIINRFNNKVYIGQSNNLGRRKQQHWNKLLKNCHSNLLMQKDYNEHKFYFAFEIITICNDPLLLNDLEIYWINFYDSRNPLKGYNKQEGGEYKRKPLPPLISRNYKRTTKYKR